MTLTWGGLAAGPVLYSFGPRYDLPLPLSVFQWTGAAVVGISFIMMTLFASHRTGPAALRYPQRELTFLGWLPNARWLRAVAVDSQGRLYILERSGHALRVVGPGGKVRTVAGRGGEFMRLSQSSYRVQVYPIDRPNGAPRCTSTQTCKNWHASYIEATV